MLITRETDYALRMLRVLLDEEKHSAAEMAETELDPHAVCLSDPAKALRWGAGAGEPGRSRRLPAVL